MHKAMPLTHKTSSETSESWPGYPCIPVPYDGEGVKALNSICSAFPKAKPGTEFEGLAPPPIPGGDIPRVGIYPDDPGVLL